jgi:hypothetical protein
MKTSIRLNKSVCRDSFIVAKARRREGAKARRHEGTKAICFFDGIDCSVTSAVHICDGPEDGTMIISLSWVSHTLNGSNNAFCNCLSNICEQSPILSLKSTVRGCVNLASWWYTQAARTLHARSLLRMPTGAHANRRACQPAAHAIDSARN